MTDKANVTDIVIVHREIITKSITYIKAIKKYSLSAVFWDIYRPYLKDVISKNITMRPNIVFFTDITDIGVSTDIVCNVVKDALSEHFKIIPNVTVVFAKNILKECQFIAENHKTSDNCHSLEFYNTDLSENINIEPKAFAYLGHLLKQNDTVIFGDMKSSVLFF